MSGGLLLCQLVGDSHVGIQGLEVWIALARRGEERGGHPLLPLVAIDDIHLVHEVLEQGISILDQNM
jgi:hypothetical protein